MATNECIPFYEPGKRLTFHATEDVGGKRFVAISDDRAADGLISCGIADADARAFGVSTYDVAEGGVGTLVRGSGFVVPIVAEGAITAGDEVAVGAAGGAAAIGAEDTGVPVGIAVADAADGEDAQVALL